MRKGYLKYLTLRLPLLKERERRPDR